MTMQLAARTIAIINFNLLPSRYLHASRRPQYFPEVLVDSLFATDRAAGHLSQHILKTLHIEDSGFFDENWPHWPIVLAQWSELESYAHLLGALLLQHVLRQTILREDVISYRQQLGELYPFIMEKGYLLFPGSTHIPAEPASFLDQARKLGWLTLLQAAALFPPAVQKRFTLKLPDEVMTHNIKETTLTNQQALALLTRVRYEMDIT